MTAVRLARPEQLRAHRIGPDDTVRLAVMAGPADGLDHSVVFAAWDPGGSQRPSSQDGSVGTFLFLSGSGTAHSDGQQVRVTAGDLLVLPAGRVHHIEADGEAPLCAVTTVVPDGGFAARIDAGPEAELTPQERAVLGGARAGVGAVATAPQGPARRLGELSAPDARDRVTSATVVVQPIGAVEQHGPHLPLATDAIMADAIVSAVMDDRSDLDLLVLPTLAYGTSTEHLWAAGTVTLSTTTLLAVLDDIGRSVATLGAQRLALVNGHGGNTRLLQVACRDLRVRYGLLTFLLHPSIPPDHGGPPGDPREGDLGIHGGMDETSMMLHLRADLVDLTRATRNIPSWLDAQEQVSFTGGVDFGWTSQDFGTSGVIGDPTLADADVGKQRFEAAVDRMGHAFDEISRFDFPARVGRGG